MLDHTIDLKPIGLIPENFYEETNVQNKQKVYIKLDTKLLV